MPSFRSILLLGLFFCWGAWVPFCAPAVAAGQGDSASENFRGDARLADVCHVGDQLAWAVGDRGAIWHTRDGGRSWHLQESGAACRLNSVVFLDENIGWAAGGWTQPYTHTTRGVLLRTRDGGRRWTQVERLLLPTLLKIKFFGPREGVAIGRTSALFPSGVFTTGDGGRTWTTVPARPTDTWRTGDFIDRNTGALAGDLGALATVRRRSIDSAPGGVGSLRSLSAMTLIAPGGGWLVGDGGLILTTGDLGRSWQTPPGELPATAAEHFDLRAVYASGAHCWVAGTPGSRVFHTSDSGRTWSAGATGNNVPLSAITFSDASHGYAVGALGTILTTDDGGRSWRTARSGGSRVAWLGIYSQADDVPLELFAQLSAADGYLGALDVLCRRAPSEMSTEQTDLARRTHEAVVAAGGSSAQVAWRFPVRQAGLALRVDQLIRGLDRANDGRALSRLEAHLVRQIRMWRPEVITTHDAAPQGDRPLAHLINQLVLRAVEAAADPTQHLAVSTEVGLAPWRVKKVYGTLAPGQRGATNLNASSLVPQLGCSPADYVSDARGLLEREYAPSPSQLGFRLLVDHVPQDRGRRDFFSGITLAPGGEARRPVRTLRADNLGRLQRLARRRRNMQEILRRNQQDPAWLAQVSRLTQGLDTTAGGAILHQLAGQYRQSGRPGPAAEVLALLTDRYPEHAATPAAQLWLVKYYASSETALRIARPNSSVPERVAVANHTVPIETTRKRFSFEAQTLDQRLARATALAKRVEQTRPLLFAQPQLRFPLAAAQRKLGYGGEADRFYFSAGRTRPQDAWWACAQAERWLAEPTELPPKKPMWTCRRATARPHLDGRLDEPCWSAAAKIELKSVQRDDAEWPAVVMLAYDDEFLYIAIQCRKASGAVYPETDAPRPRDPDLSSRDRVELFLDVDRDYATYWRLTIDHRGWTGEACWGDESWNPTWYVAAASDREVWTAEAAIPLAQLTSEPPAARHVWALGAQRIVPGVGFQAWTQPAAIEAVPQGFGLLVFE